MYQAIVIDDEKWVVKSLIATIKNQDYFEITTEFYDGLSGLEYIRIHQPALAFVDVRLPGMGGLEILQAAHAEGLSTLFIMISGHAEFAYAQKAMFHNAIGYCLKPFSRSELRFHAKGLSASSGAGTKSRKSRSFFGRAAKHFSSSASCFFPQICADDD